MNRTARPQLRRAEAADGAAAGDAGAGDGGLRNGAGGDAVATPAATLAGGAALVVAATAFTVAVVWGRRVQARHPGVKLGAAPFVGRWHLHAGRGLLPAVALAVLVCAAGPALAARLRLRSLVAVTAAASALWTFVLAASDGLHRVLAPVVHPTEYWAVVPRLGSARTMLRHYTQLTYQDRMSVHVKGHPPGMPLLLKALRNVGLGHPWTVAALSYAGAALMVAGVLATVRAVSCDDAPARRIAPFLVVAPWSVWAGTSADALFSGVAAAGTALVAVGLARHDRRSTAVLAAGGALLALACYFTYAAALFLVLPGALVTMAARAAPRGTRVRVLAHAVAAVAGGALPLVAAFTITGFWWPAGLRTTHTYYWLGTAQFRTWTYFLLADAAVALVVLGPAVVHGLGRATTVRGPHHGAMVLAVVAMAGMAAATLSQYTKGEVERIWLLWYPWVTPAVLALPPRRTTAWVWVHAATALVLQAVLVSKW